MPAAAVWHACHAALTARFSNRQSHNADTTAWRRASTAARLSTGGKTSRQACAWQHLPAVPRVADTSRLHSKLGRCLILAQLMLTGACWKASLWVWFVRAPAHSPHLSCCPLLRNRRRASLWVWSKQQATCTPLPPCTAPTSGHLRRCCRVSGWVASAERCRQERMPLCCALLRRRHLLCCLTGRLPVDLPRFQPCPPCPSAHPTGWRAEAEAAFQRLLGVARLLMRAVALALQQPEAFFTDKCEDPVAQLVLFRCASIIVEAVPPLLLDEMLLDEIGRGMPAPCGAVLPAAMTAAPAHPATDTLQRAAAVMRRAAAAPTPTAAFSRLCARMHPASRCTRLLWLDAHASLAPPALLRRPGACTHDTCTFVSLHHSVLPTCRSSWQTAPGLQRPPCQAPSWSTWATWHSAGRGMCTGEPLLGCCAALCTAPSIPNGLHCFQRLCAGCRGLWCVHPCGCQLPSLIIGSRCSLYDVAAAPLHCSLHALPERLPLPD